MFHKDREHKNLDMQERASIIAFLNVKSHGFAQKWVFLVDSVVLKKKDTKKLAMLKKRWI